MESSTGFRGGLETGFDIGSVLAQLFGDLGLLIVMSEMGLFLYHSFFPQFLYTQLFGSLDLAVSHPDKPEEFEGCSST